MEQHRNKNTIKKDNILGMNKRLLQQRNDIVNNNNSIEHDNAQNRNEWLY